MRILIALLFAVWSTAALAQTVQGSPDLRTETIANSSGNVAAATATATLAPSVSAPLVYICGFSVTSSGSTAAAVVNGTITGINGGPLSFVYSSVAGVLLGNPALVKNTSACVQATNSGVSIVVSMPSLGAGNTNTVVNAWGFRR